MICIIRQLIICMMVTATLTSKGQLVSVKTSGESIYTATRNGKNIGWLKTNQFQSGNETWFTTESQLVVDVLISFTAKAKGIYLVSINDANGTIISKEKIIK